MRSIATATLLLTLAGPTSGLAQEPQVIPAPGLSQKGSDDAAIWHILGLLPGEDLSIRSGPGSAFRVIGGLGEGSPVRLHGCRDRDGEFWCRVSTYTRPRISGWVNGRYVSDEFVPAPAVPAN